MRNDSLEFRCQWVNLRSSNHGILCLQKKCGSEQVIGCRYPWRGRYYADESTLESLGKGAPVLFRYCAEMVR